MTRPDPPSPARPWLTGRGGLALSALTALPLLLAYYAGPAWVDVLYELGIDGLILLAWLLAAAGFGASLLAPFRGYADDSESGALRAATCVALGLGVISLAVLGLGLAGWLRTYVAWALLAAGIFAGAAVFAPRWRGGLRADLSKPLNDWAAAPAGWNWLLLLVLPLLAMVLVCAIVPSGMLWHPDEPLGYDVVEYHFQVPREWYEAGRILPLRHNVFSYFPFNVEMQYLLAMHLRAGPWKGMYLAQLMHLTCVALSVVAVYGLASSLSPDKRIAPVAALATATVPWLALLAPMGYNEGGLLLYTTLAAGWAALALRATGRAALSRLAVAGAMAGLACGVKLTAVPTLLLFIPVAVVGVAPRASIGAVVFGTVGLLFFAPWLARNYAWAHNPVFPEAASLLGRAHFTPAQVQRFQAAHSPRPDQRTVTARLTAAWWEIARNWRFGFVPLPLGLACGAWTIRQRQTRFLLVVVLLIAVFWLVVTHLQGRFFVQAVPLLALLVALAPWRWWLPVAVVIGCGVGWFFFQRDYTDRLYEGSPPWVTVVGAKELAKIVPPPVEDVPPDATLVLIGDAKAFWYQRPMTRLKYRTVFDVDARAGASAIDAWRGPGLHPPDEWLLVDAEELRRFEKTYRGIPAPPPELEGKTQAILIRPGEGLNR